MNLNQLKSEKVTLIQILSFNGKWQAKARLDFSLYHHTLPGGTTGQKSPRKCFVRCAQCVECKSCSCLPLQVSAHGGWGWGLGDDAPSFLPHSYAPLSARMERVVTCPAPAPIDPVNRKKDFIPDSISGADHVLRIVLYFMSYSFLLYTHIIILHIF